MPKPRTKALSIPDRLTEPERVYVATLLARYVNHKEVMLRVQEEFGKSISLTQVKRFLQDKAFGPLIQKYRRQWKLMLEDVPVYNKRFRLEKLQSALDGLEEENASTTDHRRENRRELLALLKEAREESERYKDGQTTNILIQQFSHMSDEELQARKREILTQIQQMEDTPNGATVAPQQGA